MADQSYFVKIFLIILNECSYADIAQNDLNLSEAEQRTRTNLAHSKKQMAKRKHHIQ